MGFMATGGAIGDALFFFISGFTLFLGRDTDFMTWYKRRLSRIMPSVVVCALAYAWCCGPRWYGMVGGYWFIRCILIYYVLLFIVRRFMLSCLWLPFVLTGVVAVLCWMFFVDPHQMIYGGGYFMWILYFLPMLFGAVVGLHRESVKPRLGIDCIMLCVCVASFYGLQAVGKNCAGWAWISLTSVLALLGIMFYLYKFSRSHYVTNLMSTLFGQILCVIGSLCLEVYLAHRIFLVPNLNGIFPLNLPILFGAIVVLAYLVRLVSRFWVQTFNGANGYDFHKMLSVK